VDRRIDVGAIGGGILRKGRTSQKRGAEQGSCQIVRFHFNLQCECGGVSVVLVDQRNQLLMMQQHDQDDQGYRYSEQP
jgi:hypothetical protein